MFVRKKWVLCIFALLMVMGFLWAAPALLFSHSKDCETDEVFMRERVEEIRKCLEDYLGEHKDEYGYSIYEVFYEHFCEYSYQEERAVIWLDAAPEEKLTEFGKQLSTWLDTLAMEDSGVLNNRPSVWILIDTEMDRIPEMYFCRDTSGGPMRFEAGAWESEMVVP